MTLGARAASRASRLLTILLAAAVLAVLPISPAFAAETMTLAKTQSANVLVGTPISVTLTATNSGDVPDYNLSYRDQLPAGVTYVPGSTSPVEMGEPRIITTGSPARQTLLWENVSDLPVGANSTLTFNVNAAPATYPVGSTIPNSAQSYANSDPRTIPRFDAAGVYASGATAQASAAAAPTSVSAIQVRKTEPSPEHELVRGVHNHPTTYTLTVTNNSLFPDNNVVLVDYLPAGMEFLGCGTVDNTAAGVVEYPGAPRLDAMPDVPGCAAAPLQVADSVTTVTNPAGFPAGVYTRVEWQLGNMPSTDVITIKYAAGIPQRSNVAFPGGTAATGVQGANLDNNTGASTRETATEIGLTNTAQVSATYTGPVAPSTPTTVSDQDTLTVTAEDLAIQKSVSPGTFTQGQLATYTLQLQASEYADSAGIAIVDTLPDGLCPVGGPGTNYTSSNDPQCDGSASTAPSTPFASDPVQNPDGTWTIPFNSFAIAANGTATVTFQARMRATYVTGAAPTAAGDDYTNTVALTAQTTTLASVNPPGGVSTLTVNDVSAATITSPPLVLDKRIQPNTTTPYTCSNTATDYNDDADPATVPFTFNEGSRVCFTLRIDFPGGNDTKNPVLTDFLPDYLTYEAGSAQALPANNVAAVVDPATLTFTLGNLIGADRFVAKGSVFLYRISGIVTRPSAATTPDVTGNLAKLRWTNTAGVVKFLRDREDFSIAPPPPVGLVKSANRITAVAPGTTGNLPDGGTTAAQRIRVGDVVEFTVAATNNGTAGNRNNRPVVGPDVWDRLPRGITCADVSVISDAGVCTDPGDGAHPTFVDRTTRSAIRWNTPDTLTIAPGATKAFTYRITYPASTSATRTYRNDVDVASYGETSNINTVAQHFPASNVDTTVTTGQVDAPVAHDDHSLLTPAAGITKTNVTETDDTTQGSDPAGVNYAAIGETVTYTVTGSLPANTTVYDAVLSDTPPAGIRVDAVTYEYRTSSVGAFGPLPGAGFTTTAPPAAAQITFPASWTPGVADDEFRMTITATVTNLGALVQGSLLRNTARLTSNTEYDVANTTQTATSDVTVVEPSPSPTKTASPTTVVAGQTVGFTVTARNVVAASPGTIRPTLFEAVLVDCVPAGLAVNAGSLSQPGASVAAVGTNGCAAGRTPIVWTVGDLPWRSPADAAGVNPWPVLTYQAVVSPSAGGGASYTNTVTLTGTSMDGADPDERTSTAGTSATVTVPGGALVKSVLPTRAPVGALVTYTIDVALPADVNFYDATIVDTLPAGIDPASILVSSSSCVYTDGPAGACATVVTSGMALGPTGTLHGWEIGNVASDPRPRRVTVVYTALVADVAGNTAGTPRTNSAVLRWNQTDTVGSPGLSGTFDSATTPGTATVTILEPNLSINKTVDDATPVPGQLFTYSIRITNATGASVSDAHDVTIVDTVPAGVVPVTPIPGGGVLSGNTITWTDLGPIAPGANLDLSYQARLATPAPSAAQTNVADITRYTSINDGGRVYNGPSDPAVVTAGLPVLSVDKTLLDGPPSYLGEPTRWQIAVTNTGAATAFDVDVTDVLPAHWTYDADSARVTVAGGPAVAVEPTASGSPTQTLTWDNLGDLDVGESIVVVLSATPGAGLVPGNIGASVAQVNSATATGQDLDGPGGNVVTTDNDTAQTHVDSADLTLTKVAVGTPVAGAPFSWTVTVANDGPDVAVGPFTVTDTLPTQVTGVTASGTGWSCSVAAGVLTCVRTAPTGTLASGTAFPVITVTGTVPAGLAPGTDLVNSATVDGSTYDPDPTDNTDSTTDPSTVVSDFGIDKEIVGALVPGASASYTIDVNNAGPSVSRGPIVVQDTLPAGLTFVSQTGTGWSFARTGQQLTWTWTGASPVAVGSLPQITITVDVASDVVGTVTNTASVTEPTDPTTGPEAPDSDSEPAVAAPSADLGITKASITDFDAGTDGVYEMVVTNDGPSDAAGPITVTDTLPADLTYVSVSSADGWTCSVAPAAPQDLTCTRAAGIAVNGTVSFQVTVAIDPDLDGNVVNTASVDGPTPDPNGGNDQDTDDTGIQVEADLTLTKTLMTDPVVAGSQATYEIAVSNGGPATSPGPVVVTDTLPAGLSYASAGGAGWACGAVGQVVTCTLAAALPEGPAPVITLVVDVASDLGTTTLTNLATVDGPATDPGPDINTTGEPTPVTEDTELTVVKSTVGPDPVRAGENVTFSIVVSSSGPSDARAVSAADTLPAGLTLVSMDGPGWTCTATLCTRDRIAAGTSAPAITVVARVAAGTPDGATLTNSVTVATSTPGDDTGPGGGNTDDASVDVVAEADLELVKTHPTGTAVAGTSTTFDIDVTNNGPSDAVGPLTVTDTLPAGLTFLSGSAPWTCAEGASPDEVVCTLAQGLLVGTSAPTLTLQVQVADSAPTGTLTNSAEVASGTVDPLPGNNTDPADVLVQQEADVSIVKTHSGAVRVRDELTFELLVANDGPSIAQDVVVTDALPTGLEYVSATGTGWSCTEAAGTVKCTLAAPLGVLATAEPISLVVRVLPSAFPQVTNLAEVTTSTPDSDPDNDSDADPVAVPPLVNLSIDKSHAGDLVVGDVAVYELAVTNDGPTAAPGPITVVDTLPAGLDFVSGGGGGFTCAAAGAVVTCVRDAALGAAQTVTLELRVDVLPAAYPEVVNAASVTSEAEETDPDDNTDDDPAPVTPTVDLDLVKEARSVSGSRVTYRLTVTNNGPSATVKPIKLRDPMPAGLRLLTAEGKGWSCTVSADLAVCLYADQLAAGDSTSVEIVTEVTADAGTSIENVAMVAGGGDSTPDEGSDTVTVPGAGNGNGSGGGLPDTGGPALWILLAGLLLALSGGVVLLRRGRAVT